MKNDGKTALLEKRKNRRGAAMLVALMLIFLCSILGTLLLGFARLRITKIQPDREQEAERLAAVSAVEVMREQLVFLEETWETDETESVGIQKIVRNMLTDFVIDGGNKTVKTMIRLTVNESDGNFGEKIPEVPAVWIHLSLKEDENQQEGIYTEDETAICLEGSVFSGTTDRTDEELEFLLPGSVYYDREDKVMNVRFEEMMVLSP